MTKKKTFFVIIVPFFAKFTTFVTYNREYMKTETVELSQVKVNDDNPRLIKEDKFTKLVNSILVLPKMLQLRPIVVDLTKQIVHQTSYINESKRI